MSDNSGTRARRKHIRIALVIAALQIGGALLLALARRQGMIDDEATTRGVMVLIGLALAAYGNIMPKMLDGPPPPSLAAASLRQAISRVGGWALMLGGLAYAGLWAFAPREVALPGCIAAVGTATIVTCGYATWRFLASRGSIS